MTPEEKQNSKKMENTKKKIQTDVMEIKAALLGNSMSGDKGLVGRIEVLNLSSMKL
jgi:hypothetical protein